MKLHKLNHQADNENIKLNELISQFTKLLAELEKRELPDEIVSSINNDIDEINAVTNTGNELKKQIEWRVQKILKLLEKNLKLVPKNYYRNMWMVLGIAVFGLPIGILMGVCWDSMAYLSIGLPIGLVIGLGLGAGMDNKALKEGRQLDVDIN
ncbi:MAG TPA: hypothetical protein PK471_03505 [Bacteroidales bacterium]|nr:hypothetical protein [Bacteroidales bacterium]HPB57868.1 hypothetical protein [Bacteroidales bacterium]HPZ04370.1 hypothetical protein [Bacteroidales bacterium]HQQ20952.1 hypothetical protein [Bacteroidales bacterium]